MKQSWSQFPFVRILFPFIIGILVYRNGMISFSNGIISSILEFCFLLFSFVVFYLYRKIPFRYRIIAGVLASLALCASGFLVSTENDLRNDRDFIGHFSSHSSHTMLIDITNQPIETKSSVKTIGFVRGVYQNQQWVKGVGKIILYFEKDSSSTSLQYGDQILVRSQFSQIQQKVLDSDFDYRKFLEGKNIYHQAYIPSGNAQILKTGQGNIIIEQSIKCRIELMQMLEHGLGDGDEYAVASAILAGDRSELSAELMQSYAGSGAMHIMSVSGLHVGVVFIMLGFLLNLIPGFRKKKWWKAILLLFFIWAYAFITGLSASVLRSAFMISFIILGDAMSRRVNAYNSIAASAFILLLFDPLLIADIGFQLSYIAVVGIIALYSPIYKGIYVKNKLLDKIWQIAAVSLAAQIATFPLSLYYFGQFPVFFLLTNLIVVPLSGIIIYAGAGSLVLWQIPYLQDFASLALSKLIELMNWTVSTIESWPGSVIFGLYIGFTTLLLIYGSIVLAITSFRRASPRMLAVALVFLIIALVNSLVEKSQRTSKDEAFLLRSGKNYIIGVNFASQINLWSSDSAVFNDPFLNRRIKQYMRFHGIQDEPIRHSYKENFKSQYLFYKNGFFQTGNKKALWVLDKSIAANGIHYPIVDLIIAPSMNQYGLERLQIAANNAFIICGGYFDQPLMDKKIFVRKEFCFKIE